MKPRQGRRDAWARVLANALLSVDPIVALSEAACDETLPPSLRRGLRSAVARPDGVAMTALLVAKLRFERLVRGSLEAEAWFARAPDEFTTAFKRYHREVRPTAFFPRAEAALFEEWLARSGRAA